MKVGTGAGAQARPRAVQSQAASPPEFLASPATAMPVIDMRVPREAAFKRFVLHPTFIRHLLGAYPLTGLDPALVERVEDAAANLVGPDLSQRLADAVWRLRLRGGRTAYLLLECQSQPDPAMPYRMLHAVATLALALSRDPPPGYTAGRVPPIHNLTVYSGRAPWPPPEQGPGPGMPPLACPVLELRRYPDPGGEGNVVLLLMRLQRCEDPESLRAAAEPLRAWARDPARAGLASAFATWITHVRLPELGVEDALRSDTLEEVLDMLETEPRTWADRIRDEGREKGAAEGLKRGLERERKLLLRQARVRFGDTLTRSMATLLEPVTDADRLEEIGEWLLVCDSGEALLARLRQA